MEIRVTYLGHSGVLAQLGDTVLLFDYYTGELPRAAFARAKRALVFASHAHADHYQPAVHTLTQDNPAARFVFSSDI
ncbi:MAG: MBL fold metallo-hydrolase, partial [Eubacteriales bacterium]|nr:MBL fold metallo-hydrolase [Eubacteriales bacterium]